MRDAASAAGQGGFPGKAALCPSGCPTRGHGPAPTKPRFWGCGAALGCPVSNGAQIPCVCLQNPWGGGELDPGEDGLCRACGAKKVARGCSGSPCTPGTGTGACAAALVSKIEAKKRGDRHRGGGGGCSCLSSVPPCPALTWRCTSVPAAPTASGTGC